MTLTGILFRVLFIVTLISGIGAAGGFRLSNALIYDGLVRLTPPLKPVKHRVFLIEAENIREEDGDETWLQLLQELKRQKPEKIIFTFVPKNVSDAFYREAAVGKTPVVFGIRNETDIEELAEYSGTANEELLRGMAVLPPSFHGIHRKQYWIVPSGKDALPTIESIGAGWKPVEGAVNASQFRINFNGCCRSVLPRISLDRAIQGEAIAELVEHKIILVGFLSKGGLDRVHVPIRPDNGISLLEFHGHALETLLQRKVIEEIDPIHAVMAVVGVVILVFIMADRLSLRMFFWAALPIAGIYLLGIWAALLFFLTWIPATEILLAHIAIFLYLYRQKSVRQEKNVKRMLMDTSAKLRKRIFPVSFHDAKQHWSQVVTMVTQTLDLTRTIFLERVPRDHRVREVIAWNCSLSDIHERRRDYERPPYNAAMVGAGPERMEDRIFFKRQLENEDQYLIPISFGGQILGFWAYGISPEKVRQMENFNSIVADFANQIGEMLYRREQVRKRERSKRRRLFHRFASRDVPGNELAKAIELLNRRLTLQERVFDGVQTAVILYDIFGRVVHVNSKMARVLRNSDILAYEMTAKDLAVALSRLPENRIRDILRNLILFHEPASLQVDLTRKGEKGGKEMGLLQIRPLLSDPEEADALEGYPFETFGILFELYEVSTVQRSHRLKLQLLNRLRAQLCRDFSPIVLAHDLLRQRGSDGPNQKRVEELMSSKIDSMLMFLQELRSYMGRDFFFNTRQRYPIDPREPLLFAAESLREKSREHRVEFRMDLPDLIDMVLVDPDELTELILSILEVLIEDSVQETHIRIDLIPEDQHILYSFSGSGYGMPNETFQHYLFDGEYEVASPQLTGLRSAIAQTGQWGGVIQAASEVGIGMRFILQAKRLLFDGRESGT